MVSVDILTGSVEFHQTRVLGHVPEEGALCFMRTGSAIRMAKRSVLSVHVQRPVCRDLDRIGREPPIYKIKMMRSLVHPQTAATGFQSVPAPEIIGTVSGVEKPGEIDRCDFTDLARLNYLFDLLMLWRVAIIESYDDVAVEFFLSIEHRLALRRLGHHRLFGDHVDPFREGFGDKEMVRRVYGRDHQEIGFRLLDHFVEVCVRRTIHPDQLPTGLDAFRVLIAQPDKFHFICVTLGKVFPPHTRRTMTGPDYRVAALR